MSWFGKKKGAGLSGKVGLTKSSSVENRESTSSQSGTEAALLESDAQGTYNPLVWDNMPSALKEKFPHWQHSSPVLKMASSRKTESCEHSFQFTCSSFKQPNNTIPYVVMDYDTLNSISVKFDTTPGEIARLNRKSVGHTIFPGEVLYVPDQDIIVPSSPPTTDDSNLIGQLNESQESEKTPQTSPVSQKSNENDQESPTTSPTAAAAAAQSDVSNRETIFADWMTGTMEEVADTHVTVVAKYMSVDQGCVHGSLMVNKSAIMFRPHAHDPLVQEHGCHGEFEVLLPLQDITYACISKDCTCRMEERRKLDLARLTQTPPITDHNDHPHAEPADDSDNEATDVIKETSNPSSGDNHMISEVGGASESSIAKETSNPSCGNNHMTNEVGGATLEKTTNSNTESSKTCDNDFPQNDNTFTSCGMEPEEGTGMKPNGMESEPSPLNTSSEKGLENGVTSNNISSASNDDTTDGDIMSLPHRKCVEPETQQGAEFPMSALTNDKASSEDEDGLLDIMTATITPTSRPTHSNSNSSDNSESSSTSLFVERPNFLHIRVIPRPGSAYTYIPLSNVGITIPTDTSNGKKKKKKNKKVRSVSAPIQHVKNFFCFAVPERRLDDLVGFISQHHPCAISGLTAPTESKSWAESSFEFICSQALDGEDLLFHDDHFTDPDASSWEIYSLQDIVKFRQTIPRMEVEASLPLPNMSDTSELLQVEHIKKLCCKLPYQAIGHDWVLIYSTFKHGISLRTLYRNMANYEATPVLLLVRDQQKKLFGAIVSSRLLISDHFYGTGESLLFSFNDPTDLVVYPWTGNNNYIAKGNTDSIGIGSGDGHFGLWLDEYFHHGSSYKCSTFNNNCLASTEDFICEAVEAWGFSEESD